MGDQPEVNIGDIGSVPILPIIAILLGAYLTWFGVHYWRSEIKYPSDPIKSVLQGKGLPDRGSVTTSADILTAVEASVSSSAQTDKSLSKGSSPNPIHPATGNAARNQNIAKLLCAGYGWAPQQNTTEWNSLVALWEKESGWSEYADTRKSGLDPPNATTYAYGIPQARPAQKMASAGADWETNPKTQIRWGLRYIKDTYGSPSGAWAHEQIHDWY